jgi:hypothetical protein
MWRSSHPDIIYAADDISSRLVRPIPDDGIGGGSQIPGDEALHKTSRQVPDLEFHVGIFPHVIL